MSPVGAAREDQCRSELLEKGSLAFLLLPMGSKTWQREKCGVGCLGMLGISEGV